MRNLAILLTLSLLLFIGCKKSSAPAKTAEEQALAALQEDGGRIQAFSNKIWQPGQPVEHLMFVYPDAEKLTDRKLAYLEDLPNLETLSLRGCVKITDDGLVHLEQLKQLKTLDLTSCKQLTDSGLSHLRGLTSLTELNLSDTSVTADGVKDLQEHLKGTKITRQKGP